MPLNNCYNYLKALFYPFTLMEVPVIVILNCFNDDPAGPSVTVPFVLNVEP